MMRYQSVSPDYLPFSRGKKSNLRTATTTCKEENGGFDSNFEGTKGFKFRSPSKTQETHHNNTNNNGDGAPTSSPSLSETNNNNNSKSCSSSLQSQRVDISPSRGGGDVLLQWGQKKRARLSRAEIRSLTDDYASSSSIQGRQHISKIQRRGSGLMDKLSTLTMPPPPPLPQTANGISISNSRASNLRNKEFSGLINIRTIDDRNGAGNGSSPLRNISCSNSRAISRSMASKGSRTTSPDELERRTMMSDSVSRKDEKVNRSLASSRADHTSHDSTSAPSGRETGGGSTRADHTNHHEKVNHKNVIEVIEWPKIYISLSRKEKEDDFLALKGTKLPQRPKKRAKTVDRTLQYCFPGMWLSDLTKSRYEVREKKSVKKQKRRGLKGMESMDSDSE